jgi:hypothetical protein
MYYGIVLHAVSKQSHARKVHSVTGVLNIKRWYVRHAFLDGIDFPRE